MFIWQTPPEWFMPSAQQERITAMSSTHWAVCGSQSLTHVPRLPVLLPRPLAGQQRRAVLAHRRDDRAETVRQRLARQLVQQRLGIEQVDVAGPAFHEQEDDVLGSRRMVGRWGRAGASRPGRDRGPADS